MLRNANALIIVAYTSRMACKWRYLRSSSNSSTITSTVAS